MDHHLYQTNGNTFKIFIQYLIPSLLALLAVSLNTVFDAIICGNGIGSNGIAGVNIGTPLISLGFAVGLLFGTGGGTAFSIQLGHDGGNGLKAKEIFTESTLYIICIGLFVLGFIFVFQTQIPFWLGATKTTYPYAYDYLRGVMFFMPIFMLDVYMNTYSRNDGAPNAAMIATCICVTFNIITDYIFVFKFHMGTFGAALATGLASVVSVTVLTIFASSRHNSNLRFVRIHEFGKRFAKMVFNGSGAFTMEISVGVVALLFNRVIGIDLGDLGLAVYAIITTLNVFFYSLFSGLSQSIQPLISNYFGASLDKEVRQILNYALSTAAILGIAFLLIGVAGGKTISSIFSSKEPEVVLSAADAIKKYFFIYLFMGLNLVIGTYFQAVNHGGAALFIMLCRGLIAPAIFLYLFRSSGSSGLWLAQPVGEAIICILSIALLSKSVQKHIPEKEFIHKQIC